MRRLSSARKTAHSAVSVIISLALSATGILTWPAGSWYVYAQKAKQSGIAAKTGKPDSATGRKLFESTCAACHGLDARGGERGPNIATRPEVRRRSDADILTILQRGVPTAGMPAFGALGSTKLKSLTGYLRLLQGLNANRLVSGDPRTGKELFFKKRGCADCHMIDGARGFLGSDLSVYGAITPLEEMQDQITNHDQSPRARTLAVPTRDGRTFTGVARKEDNFSLQLQTMDRNFHFFDKSVVAIDYPGPPVMTKNHEVPISNSDLDALVSYLVSVARTSKDAKKLKPASRHREEEED